MARPQGVRQFRAPMLAPIESSEAFLLAYQNNRGRLFTTVEEEVAWAASLWTAAYHAREPIKPAGWRSGRLPAVDRVREKVISF